MTAVIVDNALSITLEDKEAKLAEKDSQRISRLNDLANLKHDLDSAGARFLIFLGRAVVRWRVVRLGKANVTRRVATGE